jgi:hypothetical protein
MLLIAENSEDIFENHKSWYKLMDTIVGESFIPHHYLIK